MQGEKTVSNTTPAKTSVMKQVFDGYIEDTITDEQVYRVLEPVFRLIRQGTFDRPRGMFGLGIPKWTRSVELIFKKQVN